LSVAGLHIRGCVTWDGHISELLMLWELAEQLSLFSCRELFAQTIQMNRSALTMNAPVLTLPV
jgi:hypothetical protein